MRHLAAWAMTVVLALTLGGVATAETGEDLTSTSVFPADSPLFFLQRVLDGWEELRAFDAIDKAEVQAKIAHNRTAEAAAMAKAKKDDLASRLAAEAAETFNKAAGNAADAKARAEDAKAKARTDRDQKGAADRDAKVEAVLAKLAANHERQQAALGSALERVTNDRAKEAIQQAMERSRTGLEEAQRRAGGERGPSQQRGKPEGSARPSGRPEASPSARPGGAPAQSPAGGASQRPTDRPTGRPEAAPASPGRPASPPSGRP